jgi:hypothetical protein
VGDGDAKGAAIRRDRGRRSGLFAKGSTLSCGRDDFCQQLRANRRFNGPHLPESAAHSPGAAVNAAGRIRRQSSDHESSLWRRRSAQLPDPRSGCQSRQGDRVQRGVNCLCERFQPACVSNPTGPVSRALDEAVGRLQVGDLSSGRIPFDGLTGADGEIAQQHEFAQGCGIVEV